MDTSANTSVEALRFVSVNIRDLLVLVGEQKHLWQTTHPDYYNTLLRQQTWYDIARSLDYSFEQLLESEQRRVILTLVKRWKSVRDSFLESNASSSGAVHTYEAELQFLRSAIDEANHKNHSDIKTDARLHREEASDESLRRVTRQTTNKRRTRSEKMEDSATPERHNANGDKRNSAKRLKMETPRMKEEVTSSQESVDSSAEDSHFDVGHFFDEIKPRVRSLNADKKITFRIKVMQLLQLIKKRRSVKSSPHSTSILNQSVSY